MRSESNSRKRPILVWIITIFYLISAGWTLFSFYLVYSGAIPLNETQRVYFEAQSTLDILLTIIIASANIIGAILLFMLRRFALHFFLGAFVISMLLTIAQIIFKNWLNVMGGHGLVGAAVGWLINIAIILYAYKLSKK